MGSIAKFLARSSTAACLPLSNFDLEVFREFKMYLSSYWPANHYLKKKKPPSRPSSQPRNVRFANFLETVLSEKRTACAHASRRPED
jgi:hypothetical protein